MTASCILQARMGSTRLPGKVMADIEGMPLLGRIIGRLARCAVIKDVIVATTLLSEDDTIVRLAEDCGVGCFRGATEDVLSRILGAALLTEAQFMVHATGDNPLVEPYFVETLVHAAVRSNSDFTYMAGIPLGSSVDVYSLATLKRLDTLPLSAANREHINSYIFDNPEQFLIQRLDAEQGYASPDLRLTVDTPEDLTLIRFIHRRLEQKGRMIPLSSVIRLYQDEPDYFSINQHIQQQYVSSSAKKQRR